MIKLFSADWCKVCPGVKQKLDAAGIQYQTIDVDTPEGMQEAKDNGVRALPTVIAINTANEVYEAYGSLINVEKLKEFN